MSDVEHVHYRDINAALADLVQLSRMLEIARSEYEKVAQIYHTLNCLLDKLVTDRKAALHAIDVLTETAPSHVGVDIAPCVESTGEGIRAEVQGLLNEVAAIVQAAGGLQ